ncbi:alpha/beta hydrolase [Enterococcus ratti]|nr:alpha/beta fold hydrolase [Enterococcus ratti]
MKNLPKPFYAKHGKRAVLLLHAYSGSPNDVRMLARYLEKSDYTVYAPLFTGHGTLNPKDILIQKTETWWEDTLQAIHFLESEGLSQIAVFGLSMGGIFAMQALEEQSMIGGGFFCSPISPVETHVAESFEIYVRRVLKLAGKDEQTVEEMIAALRSYVFSQLAQIQQQAANIEKKLNQIQVPVFLAQAGQDEMIDPFGVYETAKKLATKRITLQWYPNSKHVITVGQSRRLLEKDVLNFLEKLPWNEESI